MIEDVYQRDEATGVWYKGNFHTTDFGYSEGAEAEEKLLHIISHAQDKSVFSSELKSAISDWSTLYHLSARRSNLLRPVIGILDGPVLEIGAGCGAITRYLGEEGKSVVAIEGNKRRAESAAMRCRDLANVQVVATTMSEMGDRYKFNTIVVVGVLEYARQYDSFCAADDPCDAFLEQAKGLLNPGGKIVIAIENQLGLKYLSGYPEDHTGKLFFGVEDKYESNTVVTFGRRELQKKISRLFKNESWWYPFPDYKVPISILSHKGISSSEKFNVQTLCAHSVIADPQRPHFTTFALDRAYAPFARNGLLADVSNSFLVVASDAPFDETGVLAFHYGLERATPYNKVVSFHEIDNEIVVRRSQLKAGQTTDSLEMRLDEESYSYGLLWQDELRRIVSRDGWTVSQVAEWLSVWWEACCEVLHIEETLRSNLRTTVQGDSIDLIPRNMVRGPDGIKFIDQEWNTKVPIELGFLLFRAVNDALNALDMCAIPAPGVPVVIDHLILEVMKGVGHWVSRDDICRFKDFERQFQEWVAHEVPSLRSEEFGGRALRLRPSPNVMIDNSVAFNAALKESNDIKNALKVCRESKNDLEADFSALTILYSFVKDNRDKIIHTQLDIIKVIANFLMESDSITNRDELQATLYRILRRNFDAEWYLEEYADVKSAFVDPFDHFIQYGIKEGRRPNPLLR